MARSTGRVAAVVSGGHYGPHHDVDSRSQPRALLEVTAAAASAAPASFEHQRQLLRSIVQFDTPSRTWWAYIGALDVRALRILECLFEAAWRFGTEVCVQAIAAPDGWAGPCFSDAASWRTW